MSAMPKTNIIPMAPAVPINHQAEVGALASILNNFENLAMDWPEDLFFNQAHKIILESAKRVKDAGGNSAFDIEVDLVKRGLFDEVGGSQGLWEITNTNNDISKENAAYHRSYLIDALKYRNALQAVRKAEDGLLKQKGDIAALASELSVISTYLNRQHKTVKQHLDDLLLELEGNAQAEAFTTGLTDLDRITHGGPKRGELTTVAAESSGGKSIMLMQIALLNLLAGKRVMYFSLEMSAKQVLERMLSHMSERNIRAEVEARYAPAINALVQNATVMKELPLILEDQTTDMESIEASIREHAASGAADIAVIDYVQLVNLRAMTSNETREQHVSEITRKMKAMALQCDIAVITASQLNDDGKLRESRAIGHHSDHVWKVIHGDEGSILHVVKNRSGERNVSVPILMQGHISKFVTRDQRA